MSEANPQIEVQVAADDDEPPQSAAIQAWAGTALDQVGLAGAALTVRIVSADEGRALNRDFRGRDYATNVLSFPFSEVPPEAMAELGGPYIGDLAICAPVVAREAAEQGKTREQHWAHMVVHGVLHLAGHDHAEADQATRMEDTERAILAVHGVPDPYAAEDESDPVGEGAGR